MTFCLSFLPLLRSLPGKKKLHSLWKDKGQGDHGAFPREMFHRQSFREALLMLPVSVVFSAVMWAELDVCFYTTATVQRDTVLLSFKHVLISLSLEQPSRTLTLSTFPYVP